jgi:hypothetical protein
LFQVYFVYKVSDLFVIHFIKQLCFKRVYPIMLMELFAKHKKERNYYEVSLLVVVIKIVGKIMLTYLLQVIIWNPMK